MDPIIPETFFGLFVGFIALTEIVHLVIWYIYKDNHHDISC